MGPGDYSPQEVDKKIERRLYVKDRDTVEYKRNFGLIESESKADPCSYNPNSPSKNGRTLYKIARFERRRDAYADARGPGCYQAKYDFLSK